MTKKIFSLILSVSFAMFAQANVETQAVDYQHEGREFPPIFFAASEYNDELFKLLKEEGSFESIDNDVGTLPIGVVALVSKEQKADAANFATLMLSASTLGITPIVGGDQVSVQYFVRVQNEGVAEFTYQLDGVEATSLYSAGQLDYNAEDKQFVLDSLQTFLTDLKNNEDVQEVFEEYYLYFDEEL